MPDFKLAVRKTLDYQRPEIAKGYTDQTLHVDISEADIAIKPVAQKTRDTFIGGKGYDLWLLWNALPHAERNRNYYLLRGKNIVELE